VPDRIRVHEPEVDLESQGGGLGRLDTRISLRMKQKNVTMLDTYGGIIIGSMVGTRGPMQSLVEVRMRAFTAVIERCPDTGLFVGYVPGFPGAHSQGETLDDLQQNLVEVIGMLLEDGEPKLESEFIGTQNVQVA
jgi:predicted RNase H-like HicB family nuclease